MRLEEVKFLRYPGGKHRLLNHLIHHMPPHRKIRGRFMEPFVGSGAIFFALNPRRACLADINLELINLYRGIRKYPSDVWKIFRGFPATKDGYYKIRNSDSNKLDLAERAARTLYLNRTCFKGMWRHNADGQFNVGYGGQDRRWVICEGTLIEASKRLKHASLKHSDFEEVIDACSKEDFLFVDPPYRPGEREIIHNHYVYSKFGYNDHKRLAKALKRATKRRVKWAMTTSSHPDIVSLFTQVKIIPLPKGTGTRPGILTSNCGEVLVCNY